MEVLAPMTMPPQLDRYRILSELGRGGFGTTYLAEDAVLGRRVAVKIAGVADPDLEQFVRKEAQTALAVKSPHIAQIYDSGTFEGRPWLAIEYIEGRSLRKILEEQGRLTVQAALAVVAAVAAALDVAHRQGIIHRDIKPSNVMLRGDRYEQAVLVDFGVAGRTGGAGLTRAGQIFGTIKYMAPEQIMGQPQSAATDIYALGLLLFEMLFGRRPFNAASQSEFFQKTLNEQVEVPDDPVLPRPLRDLIEKCLEKDPKNRPRSALAVAQMAQAVFQHDSFPSPPAPTTAMPQPLSPSKPFRGVLVTAGAVLAGVLATWFLWRSGVFPGTRFLFIIAGALLAIGGIPAGWLVRKVLHKRRSGIEQEATRLLFGAQAKNRLTETLAIEVDKLVQQLDRLDDKIVGLSIAIMVQEFRSAKKSDARQKALMQMMELLEKVRYRMTPWYVRHEKLIAVVVTVLTCVSGVATAAANILKNVH